jgi:hypothetical protein
MILFSYRDAGYLDRRFPGEHLANIFVRQRVFVSGFRAHSSLDLSLGWVNPANALAHRYALERSGRVRYLDGFSCRPTQRPCIAKNERWACGPRSVLKECGRSPPSGSERGRKSTPTTSPNGTNTAQSAHDPPPETSPTRDRAGPDLREPPKDRRDNSSHWSQVSSIG